jgi:transcriptional regulator with PAS, ATPase and Fis domain
MFVLSEGATLDPNLLPSELRSGTVAKDSSFKSQTEAVARSAEKQMIVNALNSTDQKRTKAARILGISRALQHKIKEFRF